MLFPCSRMSPTEFSNYIKQRAIQQQNHSGQSSIAQVVTGSAAPTTNGHLNAIGSVSPTRSLSPNPLSIPMMNGTTTTNTNNISTRMNLPNNSYYYSPTTTAAPDGVSNVNITSMYSPLPTPSTQFGRSNLFEANNSFLNATPQNTGNAIATNSSFYSNGYGSIGSALVTAATTSASKYSPHTDTSNYYGLPSGQQLQATNTDSLGAPTSHVSGMTNAHHQTLESNLNTGNINLLVAN